MVYDEVVKLSPVKHCRQVLEELPRYGTVYGVDEGCFLVKQNVRVVGHAARDRVNVLEELNAPVAHSDVDDVLRNVPAAAYSSKLFLALKGWLCSLSETRHRA